MENIKFTDHLFTLSCSVTFRHSTWYEAHAYLHQLCSLVRFLKN